MSRSGGVQFGWLTFIANQAAERLLLRDEGDRERASRAKSDFVSRMRHEPRTPLKAILGFAQVLGREPLQASHQDYVWLILRSGQHLLELVNQVLDLAKIEAERPTFEAIVFAFRQTIAEVGGIVAQRAADKGLDFVPNDHCEIGVAPPRMMKENASGRKRERSSNDMAVGP